MGIRDWFRAARPADDREVREEIAFHLDRATQENLAKGMSPEQARAEALRGFGDLEKVRRDCLAARRRGVHPAFAWTAVAALAAASFLGGYATRGRSVETSSERVVVDVQGRPEGALQPFLRVQSEPDRPRLHLVFSPTQPTLRWEVPRFQPRFRVVDGNNRVLWYLPQKNSPLKVEVEEPPK